MTIQQNKVKKKALETSGMSKVLYDALKLYTGEDVNTDKHLSLPYTVKAIIVTLKRQYTVVSQQKTAKVIQVDLEQSIAEVKAEKYKSQFDPI